MFADIDPVTLCLDPGAAAAVIGRRTRGAAAGPHLRLPGRHPGARAPRAADRRGRLRGARGLPRRRHAGRRARASRGLRVLRQQADHDGRGRHGRARLGRAEGAHRLRAQPGPRARHGLARPRPARLQLPALRHRVRARARAARAARRHARRARPRRGLVPRGARGARRPSAASCCRARTQGGDRARLVRVRRAAARRTPTATRPSSRCASSACSRSRTCRRST